ncbi:MAG: ribonuclease III [Candidatus Cloacimonetes bacterium]|nr:ribonuclease III [Candidatus Cloacimonadota bacterium]
MKKLLSSFYSFISGKESSIEFSDNIEQLLNEIQETINYSFKKKFLLNAALTHSSYYQKNRKDNESHVSPSERMEFLGDSILGLVVAEKLFVMFPDEPEGKLTKLKSKLVCEKYLSLIAKEINLGKYIIMAEEEIRSGGSNRNSILSDSMESLICAIYLDGGIVQAKKFINSFILSNFQQKIDNADLTNYKSRLQEYSQSRYHIPPTYIVIKEEGPEHNKEFFVEVSLLGKKLGCGSGCNKKEAHQNAAKNACEKLKI